MARDMERTLVVFPIGGLANRLRAAASGWLLARACGRSFHLNWTPGPYCGAVWSDLFQNPFPAASVDPAALRADKRLYHDDERALLPENTVRAICDDPRPVIGIQTNQPFRPPGCADFRAARGAFYRSLEPVAAVENELRRFTGEADVREMVGVHIRRGDLISDKGLNPYSISPIGDFIKSCRKELAARRPRGFFLATDSPRDERRLRREFGASVFSRSGRVMDWDSVAGVRDALIDWLLLSRTQFVIRSYYSSFSKEACAVNGIGSRVIVRERGPVAAFLADLAYRPRRKSAQVFAGFARALRGGSRAAQ